MDINLVIIILSALFLIVIYYRYEELRTENYANFSNDTEAANAIAAIHKKPSITVTNLYAKSCNLIPSGTIIMWHGSTSTIPEGWVLCDGRNGTPNTINRYPLGASTSGVLGTAAINAKGVTNTIGNHSHSISGGTSTLITNAGGLGKDYTTSVRSLSASAAGNHAHTTTINKVTQLHPLRTSVIFIMKT